MPAERTRREIPAAAGIDSERCAAIEGVVGALTALALRPAEQRLASWELNRLRDLLQRWTARWRERGASEEVIHTVRLATELAQSDDRLKEAPITAAAFFVQTDPEAKMVALARYCVDEFERRDEQGWRDVRDELLHRDERQLLIDALTPEVLQARADKQRRAEGGRKGGLRRHSTSDTRERVFAEWQRHSATPDRERAKRIAAAIGIEVATVRYHLRALELGRSRSK